MLKTEYKDALFDGQRRYRQVINEDGTVSMVDSTTYTQTGDKFGANDINATNTEINRMQSVIQVEVPAANWSNSAPYTQTIAIPGIRESDAPIIGLILNADTDANTAKQVEKAYSCVKKATAQNGQLVLYAHIKKPQLTFWINIKGVS